MRGGQRVFLFRQRIFLVALALSLLAHLIAAGNSSSWWAAPVREIPYSVEARLSLPAAPVAPPASPRAARRADARASPPPAASPAAQIESAPPDLPPEPLALPPSSPEPLSPPSAPDPPPATAPVTPAPPRAPRKLPERIALRYGVQSGEDGFSIGQTTYSGQIRDGRYSLVSVTEATGVTALFVNGKIIQTSEGQVTANGLRPTLFWSVKGERRQPPVRFDWDRRQLLLPGGGVELPPQAQDLMSFPFHLAMLVHEDDAGWSLPVTNGKKLREYHFRVVGRERLEFRDGGIEALRLQGSRSGEGSLDVWLAPDRDWLPVRIRMLDQNGKVIALTLQDDFAE